MMEKREKVSKIILIIFILFFLFTLLQFLSPLFLPSNTYTDLSGMVAVSDNQESINSMPLPWNIAYSFGDRLCHQKSERSFFINGNQMPFCARCTAIWIGLVIGLTIILFYRFELNERFILLILLSLVPIGIDGTGQLFGLWESSNLTRTLTGLILGIPFGIAIGIIIDEIKTIYKSKNS
jgi:uncharacterized membrane protein